MDRRGFIKTGAGVVGGLLTGFEAEAQVKPCPPPSLSVDQGTTVSTACNSSAAAADWQSRISGSGVVWYHNFDNAAEVDRFRWAGGYGNDPLKQSQFASTIISWQPSGGADGGAYMQLFRPAGTGLNETYVWWRQFSPLRGASNGRGVDDPAANGTIPLQDFNPTSAGQQTTQWARNARPGWYGKPGYELASAGPNQVASIFDGNEFYLQLRVRARLDRMTTGDIQGGKFTNFTDTIASHTNQELVTTSGYPTPSSPLGGPYQPNLHFMYEGAFTGGLDQHPGSVHNTTSPKWAYSGGWDTLLYHFIPGTNNVFDTVLQVWAAHPGETTYTKIWDLTYRAIFEDAGADPLQDSHYHKYAWNAFMCWIYQNGLVNVTDIYQGYDQIIFSKSLIPCPSS